MQRWQVGDVEIVRVVDVDFAMPTETAMPAWAIPTLAPSPDEYRVAFSTVAISHGDTRIVVDPWLQAQRGEPDAADQVERLLGDLASVGFPADEVDVVVNSHLDGLGWNTRPSSGGWVLTFPNARYLYPADEITAVESGVELPGGEDFPDLAGLTSIEAVDDVVGLTNSVSVEVSGGHSRGHTVVRVDDSGELALYLGHLVLHPIQIHDPATPGVGDEAQVRTAYLGELADRDGTLLTTLVGGPGGGRVRREGDGYRL